MTIVFRSILLFLLANISGCRDVSFKDVSDVKPYSEVMRLTITSKKELIMHGWTGEDFTIKNPLFYSFSLPPGTSNRFVKSHSKIPSGLILKIVAVERCTDCYLDFEPRIRFRVTPLNITTVHELPVYLKDSFLVLGWGQGNEPTTYSHSIFSAGS